MIGSEVIIILSPETEFTFLPTHRPGTKTVKIAEVLTVRRREKTHCAEDIHQHILEVIQLVKRWPITKDESEFNTNQAVLYKYGRYYIKASDVLTLLGFKDRYSKNCIYRTLYILKIANYKLCVNILNDDRDMIELQPQFLEKSEMTESQKRSMERQRRRDIRLAKMAKKYKNT
jgi:hypothetical protein